jgi:hypothetical protein
MNGVVDTERMKGTRDPSAPTYLAAGHEAGLMVAYVGMSGKLDCLLVVFQKMSSASGEEERRFHRLLVRRDPVLTIGVGRIRLGTAGGQCERGQAPRGT